MVLREITALFCCCQLARKAYRDVDARLFDKYVEEKAGPVIGALEQDMYVGMFDWSANYNVTGQYSGFLASAALFSHLKHLLMINFLANFSYQNTRS